MFDQAAITADARDKSRAFLGDCDLILQVCLLIIHPVGTPIIADPEGPNRPCRRNCAGW